MRIVQSSAVFGQWIRLEADLSVQTFCVRPVDLDFAAGKRLAEFWVRRDDREMLLIVNDESPASTITIGDAEFAVLTIPPAELVAARLWMENWERMLPAMTSCRQQIPPSLKQSRNSLPKRCSFPALNSFGTGDLTLVRAAVFNLLHDGRWPDLRLSRAAQAPSYRLLHAYRQIVFWSSATGQGYAGAFAVLLECEPVLAQWLTQKIRRHAVILDQISTDGTLKTRLRGLGNLHTGFLMQCRAAGITAADYPLNTDRMGIRSLSAH